MFFLYFVLTLNFINGAFGGSYTKENIFDGLPPIFHIDDYEACRNEKNIFCKVSVILKPSTGNLSHYWTLIQRSIEDKRAYNHNELFHAICVQDFCPKFRLNGRKKLATRISECYKEKYANLGLVAYVTDINCGNFDGIHKPGAIDIIWIICIIVYVNYVIWATYWDSKYGKQQHLKNKPFILSFSLIRNLKKLSNISMNPDFNKLKCVQGIRFYNMLLIIFCHTYSSYIGGYVMNTEYIENIPQNPIKLGLRNLMSYLVQTYFLFSAFLMSYHFFQIMSIRKQYDPKIIWLTFINRYLRIVPPMLVMILMGSTMWVVSMFHGPIKDLYSDLEYHRCQKNWWTSLLFINNHYNQDDMCYFTTWYLAADTQLYILSLIILSMIWKTKRNIGYFLSSFVFLSMFIPVIISFIYDLDIIYRITPENSKNNKFRSFKFHITYSSTYVNMTTYMIGLCFGYLYFILRNTTFIVTKELRVLWYVLYIGLPGLVVTISSFYYSRFVNALLCGILKPLYATGIAVGVFGMSKGIGGKIREICTWKPALILGNLTYSTYIVHYGVVFYRTATAKRPLFVSDFVMMKSFVADTFFSFLLGFLMYIFVEVPATNLQNLCVPQVRSERTSSNEEKTK